MKEGQKPASWFLDVNGEKQGPYTSAEIMKQVMDGALKLESKIFDSADNAWKLAADVIPYLDLTPNSKTEWMPPPRPVELRDIHVVDLNSEATGGVDYFALISDSKREAERNKVQAPRPQNSREVSAQRSIKSSRMQAAPPERKPELTKIIRVAPPLETSDKPQSYPVELSSESGADNTVDGPIGKVLSFPARVVALVTDNKSAFSIAAALAFVFAGTYGVVHTLAERRGRVPANEEVAKESKAPVAPIAAVEPIKHEDALGSGKNRVHRPSAGVSHANAPTYSKVMPLGMVPSPDNPDQPRQEQPREPAQYYSSGENDPAQQQGLLTAEAPVQPVQPIQADPNQNPNYGNPGFSDPNAGAVQPPGFIPPVSDPNNDPNRVPTSDPSYPSAVTQ